MIFSKSMTVLGAYLMAGLHSRESSGGIEIQFAVGERLNFILARLKKASFTRHQNTQKKSRAR
jgi:hypothetical protein